MPDAVPSPIAPVVSATLGKAFELQVGQAATLTAEDLNITFDSITEDSRCPVNVGCVWEGRATVVITISKNGRTHGTPALSLYGLNRPTEESTKSVPGYLISFVKLDPYPVYVETTKTPSSQKHTATFIVRPAPS
jgi:hypothetical protein